MQMRSRLVVEQTPGERPRKYMEYKRSGNGAWSSLPDGSQRHKQRALLRCRWFKSQLAGWRQLWQHRYAWYRQDATTGIVLLTSYRAGFCHKSRDHHDRHLTTDVAAHYPSITVGSTCYRAHMIAAL